MSQRKSPKRSGSRACPEAAPAPGTLRGATLGRAGAFGAGPRGAGPEVRRGAARTSPGGTAAVGAVESAAAPSAGLQMEAAPEPGQGVCCKPGGRLDMSHGFVHHIRRNQLARDDYDKKVKQAAKEKARRRHTPAPTRPRKPDLQVYLPRHRGLSSCRPFPEPSPRRSPFSTHILPENREDGSTHPSNPDCEESGESSSSGSSEPEPSGHQLFCLEYEADSGEVTSVIVYQDDDPGRVSEEVSAHTPLDPPMREALKLRIQEEIAKRQSRH
uniref:CB068 protein n=3 Tax=Canidae TaxID=9608 RepID=A0A8C0Q442_CANLF